MKNINWDKIIAAYQNGLTADMLQAEINNEWGVIWTIAPCSPDAMASAGRQFSRSRAQAVRHVRRAVLHDTTRNEQSVIIATELPARRQQVRDLATSEEIILRRFLTDDALSALEAAFMPPVETTV